MSRVGPDDRDPAQPGFARPRGAPLSWPVADEDRARLAQRLNSSLRVGRAEMSANAKGRMTRRQRIRLMRKEIWWSIGLGISLLGLALLPLGAAFAVSDLLHSFEWRALGSDLLDGLFWTLVAGGGALYCLYSARDLSADIRAGRVAHAEAELESERESLSDSGFGPPYSYHLVGAGNRYVSTWGVHRAFVNGGRYRVSFSPRAKVLLSIEPL